MIKQHPKKFFTSEKILNNEQVVIVLFDSILIIPVRVCTRY